MKISEEAKRFVKKSVGQKVETRPVIFLNKKRTPQMFPIYMTLLTARAHNIYPNLGIPYYEETICSELLQCGTLNM